MAPQTSRAIVLEEWGGNLTVDRVTVPDPGPSSVRVDVRACAVTRTVENAIQGGLSDDPELTPRIPGHEFAGVVDAVGEGVTGVEPGDRVLAYFYLTCGRCDACRRGDTAQCLEFGGWYGVNCDGAYAEYATVPADSALALPEDATFVEGAIAADGLATPIHVCERASIGDEDAVAILGCAGRIGIHLAQLAQLRGAHVIAVDVTQERLAHVQEVTNGDAIPVDATDGNLADRLRAATPYSDGPTVVVDTVGDRETLSAAWSSLAMGGRVVSLTTHHDRSLGRPLKEFVTKEGSLVGSRYATKDEVVRAARLLADDRIDAITTGEIGLDDVGETHRRIRDGDTHGATVLVPE